MPQVNNENATPSIEMANRFVTEASDLGLRAGNWPPSLSTDLGNGRPFLRGSMYYHRGEFAGFFYRQQFGRIELLVFND